MSITSGNHWLNLNIKARAFNHQTITCIYCSATGNHTFTTFQFPWILEEKDLDWLCLGGKRPWLNCPLPNSGILWWPCSLSSRTITLRQGKHSFSWFSEVTCTAQAVVTKLLNSHVWIKPYLVASHITSPQIMLLLLLLISSKPVASNNTSQCFGVVCQGLVLLLTTVNFPLLTPSAHAYDQVYGSGVITIPVWTLIVVCSNIFL